MSSKEESLKLKNWAVVGATDKRERYGYKIVKILEQRGYNVFPINPRIDQIAGLETYASLLEVEEQIDVVDMVVNPKIGKRVMDDIIKLGIDYVWLQPGSRSSDLKKKATENGINLVEDCIYRVLL